MPQTVTLSAGSVVTARPWQSGRELPAQRAIVLVPAWNGSDEYAIVWFPRLGDPAVGTTAMPILTTKIDAVRPLSGEARSFAMAAARACHRVNRSGAWRTEWRPAGFAIESAARATR